VVTDGVDVVVVDVDVDVGADGFGVRVGDELGAVLAAAARRTFRRRRRRISPFGVDVADVTDVVVVDAEVVDGALAVGFDEPRRRRTFALARGAVFCSSDSSDDIVADESVAIVVIVMVVIAVGLNLVLLLACPGRFAFSATATCPGRARSRPGQRKKKKKKKKKKTKNFINYCWQQL
jgi:hypothetical protein